MHRMPTHSGFFMRRLILVLVGLVAFRVTALSGQSKPVQHSVRGRVFAEDSGGNATIKISLASLNGTVGGEKTLGYEGTFVYEGLTSGDYTLTIKQENSATLVRPIRIKTYASPKTLFLEIRLTEDGSATIHEVVKDYTQQNIPGQEETETPVSKKAAREFQKATKESSQGHYDRAVEHLLKAIQDEPNFFEAYNNLGVQYQKLQQWESAIKAFQQALALRNTSVKPYIGLGSVHLTMGQLDLAAESFNSALKVDSNSIYAHLALGQIFFQKQNYEVAQDHLETATKLNPAETKKAFLLLAQIQVLRKDYKRANYYLDTMLQYFPNDAEAIRVKKNLKTGF
jgi:tetratricopeptide (TPR) repeat protein